MPTTATALRRLRDVVLTVIALMIVIPLMVVGAAVAGLDPRHWSGVSLSAIDLPIVDLNPYHGGSRPRVMDDVTEALRTMEHDSGWVMVIGDSDGRVYVADTRLSNFEFTELGHQFGGDTVGIIYTPMERRPGYESGGGESMWQRTDPVGTWTTLLFGFPAVLGAAAVLAAIVWTLVLRHRRRAHPR